ncbi:MAG: GspH/FimT family pseudopilin [Desulfobacteraceae bacterium]|jgi:Tfp pilus assembly protein FimT
MIRERADQLMTNKSGFTLYELAICLCIAGIVGAIGVPAFYNWIPDYRLRSKAKELYTDMHLAKTKAIRENDKCKLVFSADEDTSYRLLSADGVIEKTVTFPSTDSADKISFGCGDAKKNATKSGGTPPGDGISYNGNVLTFNPRGTGSPGYVYLQNRKGTSYAIGTLSSGVIFIKKWDKISNSWK